MASITKQIDFLAAGLNDPATGQSWNGAIVACYEPGTSTPKAVWEDYGKTLPSAAGKTEFTLDSNGQALVFADGIYDIKVYNSDDIDKLTPIVTYESLKYDIYLGIPYAVAGGTADDLTATFTEGIEDADLISGLRVDVYASDTNTGAMTFTPQGCTTYPIRTRLNVALQAGDVVAGICQLQFDAVNSIWVLLNPAVTYSDIVGDITGDVTGDTTGTHTGNVVTDSITEETGDNGVDVDGLLIKDSGLTLGNHLLFGTDNAFDIGSPTERVRRMYRGIAGCLVYASTDQTCEEDTNVIRLRFDSEDHDEEDVHDIVDLPGADEDYSTFTVPAGISLIQITYNLMLTLNGTSGSVYLTKNGSTVYAGAYGALGTGTHYFQTPTLSVAEGDIFTFAAAGPGGGDDITVGQGSWVYIELQG